MTCDESLLEDHGPPEGGSQWHTLDRLNIKIFMQGSYL